MTSPSRLILGASAVTPFTATGDVNEDALRQQLRRLADSHLDVWLVSSGTAEANVLTDSEVDRIAEIAVDEVGRDTAVYAMGREPRSATEAIGFARRMHDRGVHAAQVGPLDPGHSYSPTEQELRDFYDEVLSAVEIPCFLASHTSVGYEVPPGLLATVATKRVDKVVGINATHLQSYTYVPRLLEATGGDVPVLLGSPVHALEAFALGAAGVISSMDVNVAPHLYAELAEAWTKNDHEAINTAYAVALRLFLTILGSGGLLLAKAILDRLGVPAGPPRPPRRGPDAATYARADEIIAAFALPAVS